MKLTFSKLVLIVSYFSFLDRMSSLIPPEHRPKMMNVLPRHSFEVLYRLNCDSLCSDFQEDLEFRFSLGLVNIIKCFLGPTRSKKVLGRSAESVSFVFFMINISILFL